MSRIPVVAGKPQVVSASAADRKTIVSQSGTIAYSNTSGSGTLSSTPMTVSSDTVLSVASGRGYAFVDDVFGVPDDAARTTAANTFTGTQAFDGTSGIQIGAATLALDTVYSIERLFIGSKPVRSNTVGNWFGTGGDGAGNGAQTTKVGLHATLQVSSPTETILQHFVGYSFYPLAGNVGSEVGTLQGGSCESHVYADGKTVAPNTLGFEMLGRATGANSGHYTGGVIAGQATAVVDGTITVDSLIGFRVAALRSTGGSPTVTTSTALKILAPTVGTTKRSLDVEGLTILAPDGAGNELLSIYTYGGPSTGVKQFAVTPTTITGYASNGSSTRFLVDMGDSATYRTHIIGHDTSTVPLRVSSVVSGPSGNLFEVADAGGNKFRVSGAGVAIASNGITVGAGGITISSGTLECIAITTSGAFTHTGTTFGALGKAPSSQRAKINDPSGGATQDAECRAAVASIIDSLEAFGFNALS